MKWHLKTFNQLNLQELYTILKLRVDVFVVEQNCAYPEVDGVDVECLHLFATEGEKIVAYSRLITGEEADHVSIGRIVVHPEHRQKRYGIELVKQSIEVVESKFPNRYQKVHAQVYLLAFYRSFGFKEVTEHYLEDGIWHVDMIRQKA
ncbi:ElaA protein [Pelagirhabdus alkalitolerans]|uniref:ElaA protein n=1 Tax=Pelagirhabdus alkalitolerans TaxID=1612202 RepID=A0A1G6JIN5_9BACI|nr:GNAT family N-acetyltransferase [Pelagirhabdus alkalitolerans]SDC18315.1 ElaA protein [Pelagirhabdus alkalitolerans]